MSIRYNTDNVITGPVAHNHHTVAQVQKAAPVENVIIREEIKLYNQYVITPYNAYHPILQAFFNHNNANLSVTSDKKVKLVSDKDVLRGDKGNFMLDLNSYLLHNGVDINNPHSLDFYPEFGMDTVDVTLESKKELIAKLKKTLPKINTLIPAQQLEPLIEPEIKQPEAFLNDDQLEAQTSLSGMFMSAVQATKKLFKKIVNPLQAFLLGSISPDYRYDDYVERPVVVAPVRTTPVVPPKPVVEPVQVKAPGWNFTFDYDKKPIVPPAPKPEVQEEKATGKNIPGVPKLLFA